MTGLPAKRSLAPLIIIGKTSTPTISTISGICLFNKLSRHEYVHISERTHGLASQRINDLRRDIVISNL